MFATYNQIRMSTPHGVEAVKPPVDVGANLAYFAHPSLSPNGDFVAWGFAAALDEQRKLHQIRYALGIYSVALHEWKTYGDFDFIGYTAFSRDGSKVAVVVDSGDSRELLIFDRTTETMTRGPYHRGMPASGAMSWSPEGTDLAVEIHRRELPTQIAVLNLATGNVRAVGEGYRPAWSPTGEWIAYYSGDKCMVVRPDGTGVKTVRDVSHTFFGHLLMGYRSFGRGLVWSPDGKQLLLCEIKGDGPKLDVMLLDLATGRATKQCADYCQSVFGWAPLN
jgi:Tol biopolymer transport system component